MRTDTGRVAPEDADLREVARLRRRAELAGRVHRLGREDRDRSDPDNPWAANPRFPWDAWLAAVPQCWGHGELRSHRYGLITGDLVLKCYNQDFIPLLLRTIEVVQPLMLRHRIVVPTWYESLTDPARLAGACYPEMTLAGQTVGNGIILSSRERESRLVYDAVHEISHCTPDATSDLDPSVERLGHAVEFRARHGFLLDEFLRTDTSLDHYERYVIRRAARTDTWSAPLHPKGWEWYEVQVDRPEGGS